jgi:hypothetical protein
MRTRLVPVFGLAICALVAQPSLAQEKPTERPAVPPEGAPSPAPVAPAPAEPAPCPTRDINICTRQVYLIPEQHATTISGLKVREVECGTDQVFRLDIDYKEEKFVCTEMALKERTVEQEVACCKVEPRTTIDPTTGKTCTVYEEVPEVKKVVVTVYELVPVQREYVVRVPCIKRTDTDMIVKKLAVDHVTEPAIEQRLQAKIIPCEAHVAVPVCPPACLSK